MAEEVEVCKRQKMEEIPSSSMPDEKSLRGFIFERVLNDDSHSKMVSVLGSFDDPTKKAVVVLQKTPFRADTLPTVLSEDTRLEKEFVNDIFHKFITYLPPSLPTASATIVYPATESQISKYTKQSHYLVNESWYDYQRLTLPYLQTKIGSTKVQAGNNSEEQVYSITSIVVDNVLESIRHQQNLVIDVTHWVDNILSHQTESERIVFEDPDPENGFILLPDMKWDGITRENLYLVALVHKQGIKSVRDLDQRHLPLLKNILVKSKEAILDKYGLVASQIRAYFHYQPTYYHLHVHFCYLDSKPVGSETGKAIMLEDVIDNIENIRADFYQCKTMTFSLRADDPLLHSFVEAGVISINNNNNNRSSSSS